MYFKFCFMLAGVLQEPNHLVSYLRKFRGAQTIWFLICGSSARPKLFGFLFAEVPRSSNHLVSHLRNSREAQTIWFPVCGTPARLKPFSFSFAEVPRGPNHLLMAFAGFFHCFYSVFGHLFEGVAQAFRFGITASAIHAVAF